VTYIDVDESGLINPKDVESAITDKTILVSIMHANNEVGTMQDIEQIGEIPDRVEYIEVRLSDKKLYVPHSSQPIRRDESMPIREQLSGLLTEIPKEKNISFEIGETPHIRLSKDIAAVIVMGVDDESKKHINSALLDPGSNWPIRTETNGRDYIDLLIYRVKDSV